MLPLPAILDSIATHTAFGLHLAGDTGTTGVIEVASLTETSQHFPQKDESRSEAVGIGKKSWPEK